MTATPAAMVLLASAMLTSGTTPRGRLMRTPARVRIPRVLVAAGIPVVVLTGAAFVAPALPFAGLLVWLTGTRRYRRRRSALRRVRERQRIAAALEILVGELRAGAHPVNAFTAAAAESEGSVAETMRTVATRARLGADVSTGLREAARMSAAPESWERVAVYWNLAAHHGLAMATLMGAAQHDIISRQRFSDSVHAGLAGARATSAVLATLPVIGVFLGGMIGAHPMSFLLGGPLGAVLLLIGIALMCVGVIWSDRIIDRAAP